MASGSFGRSARPGFARPSSASAPRVSQRFASRGFQSTSSAFGRGPSSARPAFYNRNYGAIGSNYAGAGQYARRGRFGYYPYGYSYGLGFGYPFLFWDDGFDSFPYSGEGWGDPGDNAGPGPDSAGQSYGPQAPDGGEPAGAAPYPDPQDLENLPSPLLPPRPYAPPVASVAPPAEEDALTLIFKDGRPSERIRNYALTHTSLYITGKHTREIPLDELDLPATERVNHAAGMDFRVP